MSAFGRFWNGRVLPYVPRFVRNDFWRLLFSLFFAILFTAVAHRSVKMKTDRVKMQLKGIPVFFVPASNENIALVPRETESKVDIDVEVPGDVKDLKNTDFYVECAVTKAQIDAKDPPPVNLKPDNVKTRRVIDNLNVQAIHPEQLPLDLDYYVEKDVLVFPVYDEKEVMPNCRVVEEVGVERIKVKVRGPKKFLETIDYLETEKIPLANMNRSFSRLVHPILPNNVRNDNVRILADTIRVDVKIEEKKPITFENIPVRVLEDGGPRRLTIVKIEPETVKIEVDNVPGVSPNLIYPFLNLSNLTQPGEQSVEINCWADHDGIKKIKAIPARVTVTLEPAPPGSK